MASLEQRNDTFHVVFRFNGVKYTRSLKTSDETTAEGWKANIEETLRDIKRGKLPFPTGDVAEYILSGGKTQLRSLEPADLTLKQLFADFFADIPAGSREESTIYGMKIHEGHLRRILGDDFSVSSLTLADLQRYVSKRSKEKGVRGRKLTANTILKAIVTFQTAWNWAKRNGKISGTFPQRKDILLPKDHEKPPFQTYDEITKQINRGGLSEAEKGDLWECLYLTTSEVEEVLKLVKEKSGKTWLYPAVVMAAHTGARRSEILRAEVRDFEGDMLTIRERKRVRGKHSTRRVPISATLRTVIDEWMTEHPGGRFMFCMAGLVRSKSRRSKPEPITKDMAHDHLRRALKGSKWEVVKGYHVFRHSFVSACAVRGIDQRILEEWAGHGSETISRIYRHLGPNDQAEAFKNVFI